ncbi:MAG: hypothetical protein GY777_13510 [Candidatus Brocadiaceae bacterium]|nr:hypothetical protein [Candidatus Brocadiaceae bacterium]
MFKDLKPVCKQQPTMCGKEEAYHVGLLITFWCRFIKITSTSSFLDLFNRQMGDRKSQLEDFTSLDKPWNPTLVYVE